MGHHHRAARQCALQWPAVGCVGRLRVAARCASRSRASAGRGRMAEGSGRGSGEPRAACSSTQDVPSSIFFELGAEPLYRRGGWQSADAIKQGRRGAQ
eukprot:2831167-Prymnesium_polylepis.1